MNPWEGLTVLVVDDEPMLRATVRFEIELLGCKVLEAGSGREAKALLSKTPVGLIVSDIRMPDGDGIDLLKHVRQGKPEVPMFLMSGFADVLPWDAYDLGAEAYIGKPFNVEQLEYFLIQSQRARATSWDRPIDDSMKPEESVHSDGAFALGRGGVFVANAGLALRKDMTISFALDLAPGASLRLEGIGTVRWVRNHSKDQLVPGCGIEFICLKQTSLDWVRKTFKEAKLNAYIPRSLER